MNIQHLKSIGLEKQQFKYADIEVRKKEYVYLLFEVLGDDRKVHPAYRSSLREVVGDDGQLKIIFPK